MVRNLDGYDVASLLGVSTITIDTESRVKVRKYRGGAIKLQQRALK